MPSQEDYLDGLLKEMSEEEEKKAHRQADVGHGPDLDDVSGMSEDEIARLLEAGAGKERQSRGGGSEEAFQGDILDLEDEAGDSNLQEIQDLLKKSDRNEAIDAQPEEHSQEMGPADRLMEDIEAGRTDVADSKKQKALDKKRRKEELAAAKKAAKRVAKESARAEKEARRRHKGKKKEEQQANVLPQENIPSQTDGQIGEYDVLLDKDLLDSIVSGAGHVEEESRRRTRTAAVQTREAEETEEELEPEVLTLDLEEAAALIPEVSDTEREGQGGKGSEKKGLLSKVMNLLMEEEEETSGKENENIQISDENQEILDALDGEKAGKGKAANTKKKKAKPAKKKKKKDTKAKKAKSKPKKPSKPKKAKEAEPYIPGRKLSFKKVLPILLLGLTVGAVTFLFVNLTVDFTGKQAARKAYDAGDYQGCYLNLYGKKLNENETAMYGKSESILRMRLWYQEYMTMAENGTEAEALDCLLQIIDDYPELYEYALQWNAVPEIYEVYSELLSILSGTYGLTEAQAREITAIKSDIEYTKAVYAVTEGKGYTFSDVQSTPEPVPPEPLEPDSQPEVGEPEDGQPDDGEQPDELPEESEIENGNFVDNQG